MKRLGEFGSVNFLILFGKFQIDITREGESFQYNECLTLIYQRIFIQMIEIKDTIGNLYDKFGLPGNAMRLYIIQAKINGRVGNFGFNIIQPVIFCLVQVCPSANNIYQRMNVIRMCILRLLNDGGIFPEINADLIICNLELPES